MKALFVAVALLAAAAAAVPNVTTVASGFAWAENLHFDPAGTALFASDLFGATVNRIDANHSSPGAQVSYTNTVWFDAAAHGYAEVGGIATCIPSAPSLNTPASGVAGLYDFTTTLFVAAKCHNGSGAILALSSVKKGQWRLAATTPVVPNGLSCDGRSMRYLYATKEKFTPLSGANYKIDLATSSVQTFTSPGWMTTDGCWADGASGLLYIGAEIYASDVDVFDIKPTWANATAAPVHLGRVQLTGAGIIDDLAVWRVPNHGPMLIVAGTTQGAVLGVPLSALPSASPTSGVTAGTAALKPTTLATGVKTPTSVRPVPAAAKAGSPYGSHRCTVYVSGGGALGSWDKVDKVYRVDFC